MKKTRESVKPVSAETIARQADRGKNISHFFKGEGRMILPIQRANDDLTASVIKPAEIEERPPASKLFT